MQATNMTYFLILAFIAVILGVEGIRSLRRRRAYRRRLQTRLDAIAQMPDQGDKKF